MLHIGAKMGAVMPGRINPLPRGTQDCHRPSVTTLLRLAGRGRELLVEVVEGVAGTADIKSISLGQGEIPRDVHDDLFGPFHGDNRATREFLNAGFQGVVVDQWAGIELGQLNAGLL